MEQIRWIGDKGDFCLRNAQDYAGVYMPLVNEGGMISSVTPWLSGDCKSGQNAFLLAPASMETLHESRACRNFWVKVRGAKPFSVTGQSAWQRAEQYDRKEETVMTGGLLWQKLSRLHRESRLWTEVLSFVPAGQDKVEVMQVTLTNKGAQDVTFSGTASIPLYGRSADNIRDHRHVTSLLQRVQCEEYGITLRQTLTFDERGHKPGEEVYRVWGACEKDEKPQGFIPLVKDFIGRGSYDWPEAVARETPELLKAPSQAQGGEVIGGIFFREKTLRPGETVRYQIAMSISCDPLPYLSADSVEENLDKTKKYWQKMAAQRFQTADGEFDKWCIWTAVQPVLRRICGCSFLPHHDYGRGGRGWRDLWQDSLALLLTDPAGVRKDLYSYFGGVRSDGTNATIIGEKPGEFKADRNNIPRVWMDHGFWPVLTVKQYLDETGDLGFLSEDQAYFADTLPFRGEGGRKETPGAVWKGSIFEHMLVQTVTAFFDVGDHGNMRLRGADWNDGMDMAGQRGESVAFTAAYAYGYQLLFLMAEKMQERGKEEIRLHSCLIKLLQTEARYYGCPERMREALREYCEEAYDSQSVKEVSLNFVKGKLSEFADYIRKHIRSSEWTGDGAELHWFNGYYDNSKRALEGVFQRNGETRIHMTLTGQVFCLLSGAATDEMAEQIIRSADWYLCYPLRGGYCLNTDFDEVKLDMGRMFGFAYGHKENGAVFCHMAVMYAYALYSRGFVQAGYKVLMLLYQQSSNFERSRILPGIPEYFDDRGVGMYPYLTGAGSWLMLTLQTQAFGVRGEFGKLILEPKLCPEQFDKSREASVRCFVGGHALNVVYHNPKLLPYGGYRVRRAETKGWSFDGECSTLCIEPDKLWKQGQEECRIYVTLEEKEEAYV